MLFWLQQNGAFLLFVVPFFTWLWRIDSKLITLQADVEWLKMERGFIPTPKQMADRAEQEL